MENEMHKNSRMHLQKDVHPQVPIVCMWTSRYGVWYVLGQA